MTKDKTLKQLRRELLELRDRLTARTPNVEHATTPTPEDDGDPGRRDVRGNVIGATR